MIPDTQDIMMAGQTQKQLCSRAGFLPVPLQTVPPESLTQLEIYIDNGENYSLYNASGLEFLPKDSERLLNYGIQFVYVSVRQHQEYYKTVEKAIHKIIEDKKLQTEKKAQILYATSLELCNQLLNAPPEKDEINRVENIAHATAKMILNDRQAFSKLLDVSSHDFYTSTHMVNVCGITIKLANELGLVDPRLLQRLGTGSLLHDIGKIFIPREILNSTRELSAEQYKIIRSHVELGMNHLKSVTDPPQEVIDIVYEHHERMDGSGYPRGLKSKEISQLGRLAAIVDTFDAMTSVRPYREHTFSVEESLQYLFDGSSKKYDSEMVDVFTTLIKKSIAIDKTDASSLQNDNNGILCSGAEEYLLKIRFYFRAQVEVKRISLMGNRVAAGHPEKIIAHKISSAEIGLLSPIPFPPEQNILINCSQFEQIDLNNITAKVTSCRNHNDGWYTLVAQFHQPLDANKIKQLKALLHLREVVEAG